MAGVLRRECGQDVGWSIVAGVLSLAAGVWWLECTGLEGDGPGAVAAAAEVARQAKRNLFLRFFMRLDRTC